MKVVVDTNVLVSGLLSPFGPPGEIVMMVASGSLSVCFDARILSEYSEVLRRKKFQFSPDLVSTVLEQIRSEGEVVASTPLPVELVDPSDHPFLEVALAGPARCVITGNVKHFPASKRHGMNVLTPAEFIEFYRKEGQKKKRSR